MKYYYQKNGGKKGQFTLRPNTYRRIWYIIADYEYFKYVRALPEEAKDAQGQVVDSDDQWQASTMESYEETQKKIPEHYVQMQMAVTMSSDQLQVAEENVQYVVGTDMIDRYIWAIEQAQKHIPEIYVENIMQHIMHKTSYRDMAYVAEKSVKYWQQRYMWYVARYLGEV